MNRRTRGWMVVIALGLATGLTACQSESESGGTVTPGIGQTVEVPNPGQRSPGAAGNVGGANTAGAPATAGTGSTAGGGASGGGASGGGAGGAGTGR